MSQSASKGLIFGIIMGTAGISLIIVWYQKIRKPGTTMNLPKFLSLSNEFHSIDLQDAVHNERGTVVVLQQSQFQILEKLNDLLVSVEELKEEVRFLKEAIPELEKHVRGELRGKTAIHRTSPQHQAARKKKAEASRGISTSNSSEEAESEGGQVTSPYLPQFAHLENELEKEIVNHSSIFAKKTPSRVMKSQTQLKTDSATTTNTPNQRSRYVTAQSDTEKGNLAGHKANKKSAKKLSLPVLTRMIDDLHLKSDSDKRKSFDLLCNYKNKYKDETEFIWRLTRAYGDMCDLATDMEEKRKYASEGKDLGERAIAQAPKNGYCHLWFANLCGYVAEYGGLQNRIRYGHLFKKHLDIALEFIPDEPLLYYLNGRYCYSVFKLNWMEKKMASALFGIVPTSSVEEALRNFLKAEELKPGYSKYNYVYLAKCYKDLGQKELALMYCDSALLISSVNKQDHQAQEELENIILSLK